MSGPDFWSHADSAQPLIRELKSLRSVTDPFLELRGALRDDAGLLDLADEAFDMAVVESIRSGTDARRSALGALEVRAFYTHKDDARDALLSIQAGAGGVDAMDWAEQLERMYGRWLDRAGFQVEIVDRLAGGEAGIHYVEFQVSGSFAFGRLRSERGVHRICHISDFDANGKKQTSFAGVDVVPVHAETAVELLEKDLEFETFCSGGPGGQNVNKVASAVRVRHLPSGVMAKCQSHRSQHENKKAAVEILASKLRQAEEDRKERRPKLDASFGHQARTYVLEPYQLVKDHRTGHETAKAKQVLDGDLDGFVEAFLRRR